MVIVKFVLPLNGYKIISMKMAIQLITCQILLDLLYLILSSIKVRSIKNERLLVTMWQLIAVYRQTIII